MSSPPQDMDTASVPGEPTSSKKGRAQPQGKQQRGRHMPPTHFLCFPLATEDSVRQLTNSLAYFRSVTTPLPERDPDATPEPENHQGNASSSAEPDVEAQKLRLLPEAAHRPPGTYHLTLGTMNLSKQEDMEKAIALLQEINYIALLRDAESGDGIVKHARASARGGRRAAARSNKAEMGAESVDGTTDPVHREPHDNENAGELEREADTTKDVTSSPPHAPKSLTRAISPPPTKVSSKPPPASSTASSSLAVPPLSISLHSLGVFPKPTAARVFFAHPHDPSNRLQTFGQLIRRHFREADLITETRPLVLHATVANLIYVRGKDRRAGKGKFAKGRPRAGDGTVDATELLRFFNGGEDNPRIHNQGGGHASPNLESIALGVSAGKSESQHEIHEVLASDPDSQALSSPQPQSTHSIPYVWATDIPVTSVRICKMGAQVSDTPGWGLEYSAVAEKVFMPDAMHEQEKTV